MLEKKVCKSCGQSGYFLKLNNDFLCVQCVDLKKKEMTHNEIDRELINFVNDNGSLEKVTSLLQAHKQKERRESKSFDKIFKDYQKARQLEKQGDTQEALSIYLKILPNCPPGISYYERPCIILEKEHEYAQAIEICDLAIKNIKQGRFYADTDIFQHRKERLLKKLEKEMK
jgi:tetratricopeptide (TPR) repeat protein